MGGYDLYGVVVVGRRVGRVGERSGQDEAQVSRLLASLVVPLVDELRSRSARSALVPCSLGREFAGNRLGVGYGWE